MANKKRAKSKRVLFKKRNCFYCETKTQPDYKDVETLRKFLSIRGGILSARRTGICSKHQRKFSQAIKRARHLALLPFLSEPSI